MAIRFDQGRLKKPQRNAAGFLRADAAVTRVGVFNYLNTDGTIRRELRHPDEVFDAQSLASLDLVPVTNEHPPSLVTDANATKYSVGTTGQGAKQADRFVETTLQVNDSATIGDIESNKRRDLSCGYSCDKEATPGVTKGIVGVRDGLKYDFVQRNIRYNHVAVTERGRAGPSVAIPRMDSADGMDDDVAVMVTDSDSRKAQPKPSGATVMETIRIDGVEYEVSSKQTAQAFAKFCADRAEAEAKLTKQLDQAKARADSLDEQLKTEQKKVEDSEKKLKEATDPKVVKDAIDARVKLVTDAGKVLKWAGKDKDKDGKEVDLAVMDDAEIRLTAIKAASPNLDTAEKSDEYLAVCFDMAVEASGKEASGNRDADDKARKSRERVQRAAAGAGNTDGDDEPNEKKAAEKLRQDTETAWQRPITVGVSVPAAE